jgi:hypothetical protein
MVYEQGSPTQPLSANSDADPDRLLLDESAAAVARVTQMVFCLDGLQCQKKASCEPLKVASGLHVVQCPDGTTLVEPVEESPERVDDDAPLFGRRSTEEEREKILQLWLKAHNFK